jgi:hypothetical protein
VPQPRVVSDRPSPGPLPGALLGVLVGLLLGSIWIYGAWDVAFAVSVVFGGLVAVLLAGLPQWKGFAIGLLIFAVIAGCVLLSIAWYGSLLGS